MGRERLGEHPDAGAAAGEMSPREIDRRIETIGEFRSSASFSTSRVRHYQPACTCGSRSRRDGSRPPTWVLPRRGDGGRRRLLHRECARPHARLDERASIVVFATHSLDVLPRFCERTILLSTAGSLRMVRTEEVVQLYTDAAREAPGALSDDGVHERL